ncbi:MAG: phasin family protein [Pseudomonadota bacterium]
MTDQTIGTAAETPAETPAVADGAKAASTVFSALTAASRSAVMGVWEVDKALFGYARDAVRGYVDLGRETLRAKSLSDMLDLHAAKAHSRIEATVANTREIVELTREKAQEAYAPIKEVVDAYRPNKAA